MSTVRVIARIRPLLAKESESEIIVRVRGGEPVIAIPNPRNEKENFTFPFAAVLDSEATQAQIFNEGTWGSIIPIVQSHRRLNMSSLPHDQTPV